MYEYQLYAPLQDMPCYTVYMKTARCKGFCTDSKIGKDNGLVISQNLLHTSWLTVESTKSPVGISAKALRSMFVSYVMQKSMRRTVDKKKWRSQKSGRG